MATYDLEYKKMIVELSEGGKSATELSREYQIASGTIYKWVKQYGQSSNVDADKTKELEAEYRKIKKQLALLQEENEILKKCVTIFSTK